MISFSEDLSFGAVGASMAGGFVVVVVVGAVELDSRRLCKKDLKFGRLVVEVIVTSISTIKKSISR